MSIKKLSNSAFFLLTLLCALSSQGQTTGSFNETISFNGSDRTLSCFVPTDYDANKDYELIIALHGLGDNSTNYRNTLISTIKWRRIFPNAIIICPDGGSDQNSDFSEPAGDEAIIDESIAFAKANYSIDPNNITLQGFSLGGRSAMKYGLDYPEKFKALLLNTPATQGIKDILNQLPGGAYFNYANASKIPMYITCGDEDVLYYTVHERMIEVLKQNDAVFEYNAVAGMGHSIPANAILDRCISFFANPSVGNLNADIFKIQLDEIQCDKNVESTVLLRNVGEMNITSVELSYEVDGVSKTTTWNGNLTPFGHAEISLPDVVAENGKQELLVTIKKVNGMVDTFTTDNSLSRKFLVSTKGIANSYAEGFEGDMENVIIPKTSSVFGWYQDEKARNGTFGISAINTFRIFDTHNNVESFLLPPMDVSSLNTPFFNFDYAFNFHSFTPPYFTANVDFADTLQISISQDCGKTYEVLFRKGGKDLATVSSPIINPLSVGQGLFSPKLEEWKREIIDLSDYKPVDNAIIKFDYISGLGGTIFVDNFNFSNTASVNKTTLTNVRLFPNPTNNLIHIESATPLESYEILALDGKSVLKGVLETNGDVRIGDLPQGLYTVVLQSTNGIYTQRISKL